MTIKGLFCSVLAFIGVAGCNSGAWHSTTAAPAATRAAPVVTPAPVRSDTSHALEAYYSDVQQTLLTQGMLRVDGGGPDTPFTAEMLARNFMRIAMFDEYTHMGGRMVARQTPSTLHRWETPVRVQVEFGPTVTDRKRRTDSHRIRTLVTRLGRATRHPVSMVNADGNFHVFVVNEEERKALKYRLREIIPAISDAEIASVTRLPKSSYCLVVTWDPEGTGHHKKAVAVIRAEHPDLMRLSCLHEEIAQGMGLSNDSPHARPSIFNDDEEFGLLTHHDELLLQMLYDPRLKPGMKPKEAAPIVYQIANELVGQPS